MVNDVHSSKVSISDSHNKPDGNDASTNKRNSTVQFLYTPHASNFIHRSVSKKKRRRQEGEHTVNKSFTFTSVKPKITQCTGL